MSFKKPPYKHQQEGLSVFENAVRDKRKRPIVFYVTMGGGKTRMYAMCAEYAAKLGIKIMVYVPSIVIAEGVKKTMMTAGLKPSILNRNKAEAFWDADRNVMISTYAKLALQPDIHRRQVERNGPVLVICDEIHHAGTCIENPNDANRYGMGVEMVSEVATHTIYGTGTPYRSDSRILPGLEYDEPFEGPDGKLRQQIRADVTLTVADAMNVYTRKVIFGDFDDDRTAVILNPRTGTYEDKKFAENDRGLSALVEDEANWIPIIDKCIKMMSSTSRALVIANHIEHARAIDRHCRRQYAGLKPMLVHSKTDDGADDLKVFKDKRCQSRLLITVGMASEGFDEPSLTHLAYLSANRTELALDQAIGRIIRLAFGIKSAWAIGPGDKDWAEYVLNYIAIRSLVEKRKLDKERERKERDDDEMRPSTYGGSKGPDGIKFSIDGEQVDDLILSTSVKTGMDWEDVKRVIDAYLGDDEEDADVEEEDLNSDENRAEEGRRVFGKGGVIPRLNYALVGKRDPSFLIKATAKMYAQLHGKPGNKPYPVEVTLEYERIALLLAHNESMRPPWFESRLRGAAA